MRKLLFILVFMLIGTSGFTNTTVELSKDIITVEEATEMINSVELTKLEFSNLSLNLLSESTKFFEIAQIKNIIFSDCSGIKVTLGGGDSFVWSGSCAGLWRLIKAYLAEDQEQL